MDYRKFDTCITACSECAIACANCEHACLHERDITMLTRCIQLDHDCAAICYLAMDAMAGGSEFAKEICKLCEDICKACAEECEKHSHMEHCKQCAEACWQCADECRNISNL